MREALAATLIKDEDDRHIFDEIFATFFTSGTQSPPTTAVESRETIRQPPRDPDNIESESPRTTRKDQRPSESAVQKSEPSEEPESKTADETDQPRAIGREIGSSRMARNPNRRRRLKKPASKTALALSAVGRRS